MKIINLFKGNDINNNRSKKNVDKGTGGVDNDKNLESIDLIKSLFNFN